MVQDGDASGITGQLAMVEHLAEAGQRKSCAQSISERLLDFKDAAHAAFSHVDPFSLAISKAPPRAKFAAPCAASLAVGSHLQQLTR